jgi:hypothetical protein
LKGTHPGAIPARFGLIWFSSFRGEDFALHSRWPLLLKIEISSNGQNCSILSQNVPKFELYKHNDELFNKYYRIFYLIWFSSFRGEDLNVIFYQNMPNLHNRYKSAERKISKKKPEHMLNYSLKCILQDFL